MIKRPFQTMPLIILTIFILSACNLPSNGEDDGEGTINAIETSAALTVEAQVNAAASQVVSDPTLTATVSVPTAAATATQSAPKPSNTPRPTNTSIPQACDLAGFVKDVSIPDGTKFDPGETFRKKWELKNNGTCTWTADYELVFDSGDAMGGPAAKQMISANVLPGKSAEIFVDLTAPSIAGTYRGNWKLRNPQGDEFGLSGDKAFFVEIEVVAAAGATIHVEKNNLAVDQTFNVNLDTGKVSPAGGVDFFFQAVDDDNKFIDPENNAKFLVWGLGKPSYDDCLNASVSDSKIQVDDTLISKYICYLTDAGRPGYMYIKDLTPSDNTQVQTMEFSMITWVKP